MDIPLPGELPALPDIPFPDSIPLPPASIPPPVPEEDAPPLPPPPTAAYSIGGVNYTPQPPPMAPMDNLNTGGIFPPKQLSPSISNGANGSGGFGSPIKEYPPAANNAAEFAGPVVAGIGKGGLLGSGGGKGKI